MSLKRWIKASVPERWVYAGKTAVQRAKIGRSGARAALARATPASERLSLDELAALAVEFPAPDPGRWEGERWRDASLGIARDRARELTRALARRDSAARRCLELGAGDGAVAAELARAGFDVVASDHQREVFDEWAGGERVEFLEADAEDLSALADESFDLVYSYDTFEHVADPERALDEALRVTRPGGHVYLRFGPLYHAPSGKHLGGRLGVPYASVLFDDAVVDEYLVARGREPINHEYCNGWSAREFRALLDGAVARGAAEERARYEHLDVSELGMIARFPGVFRAVSSDLDEFLVNVLEVWLRKRARGATAPGVG